MGSLASELRPIASHLSPDPRVYADANLPSGAVAFMRQVLKWDVLFVLEEPELRRAHDRDHFQKARDLGRTLITLDHDFADERRFPPEVGPGVVICTAPDEAGLKRLLRHIDAALLRQEPHAEAPLRGRTVEVTMDVVRNGAMG